MKKIQYHQFNPDFYKLHTIASGKQRTITEEELDLLLQHDIHYHAALHKHGHLFKDYIINHYSPSGTPVVPKGAFFDHITRTDPSLARDLDMVRTRITESWHAQAHLHLVGPSSIKQPQELQYMLNNMREDENTVHLMTTSSPSASSSSSPSLSPSPVASPIPFPDHPDVIDLTETHTATTENITEMGFDINEYFDFIQQYLNITWDLITIANVFIFTFIYLILFEIFTKLYRFVKAKTVKKD